MAKGFNLTAELNLRGPSNIRQVVSGIRKQLTGINANVNVVFDAKVAKQVKDANQSFQSFNKTLQQTRSVATSASSALNQLSSASAKLSGNFKSIPNNIQAAANASKQISQSNAQAAKATAALTTEFEEFGKQSALAVRRFAAFATVTGAIYKVSNAISNATSDFLDFQRELIKVSQVTDTSLTGLNFLVNNITQLSTSLGVSSKELVGVSRTLAQAGLSATETSKALKALALSALAPTFDNLNNTVEGSIALMKQFSISANELEGALGSINAVAGRFAVEASDIITAISRTGGVFASASQGVSQGTDALNEFIAVFTSVRATTRESAETIATGLRTIFTRIQREDTIDALKAYGVALTDLNGKFVGPFEATRRLAEGLRSLDPRDIRFSRIVEELGGFRQIGKVIPLIQQFSTAQAALNVAQQGSSSLARDAAAAQLGFANQITKVQEQFDAFIRSIGQTSEFRDLVRLTLDLTSGLISIADAAKTALPALTAIFAIKGFSALSQFGKGFLGGIKRGGGQGLNSGGYVQHFARGGMVPGSGNRDTVNARLTPGEFVIRKKAVQAIGQDRLHAMNKYASGGKVTDFSLSSGLAQDPNSVPTWKKQKGKPFRRAGKNPHRFNPEDEFTYQKIEQTFDVSKADKRNPAVKQAVAVYDNAVRTGDARGRGRAFEGVLSAAGLVILSSGGEKKGNPRLDGFNTRGGGVAEIKSTKEQVDIANINAKMIGAALDPVGQSDLAVQRQFLSNTLRNQPDKINLGTVTVWQDTTSGLGALPDQKQPSRKNNRNLGGYIQKFASGGSVQDTVPAMLTPGEFVINKQAASRIGSQRLHKLNRADKIKGYNKGGAVGRVQRFANGGDVFDFADNISAVSAAAEKAMDDFLAGIVDKIIQAQPDISFDDAYREAQTTAGGRVAFGTMQAAQAGDQGAAKAVYDAQRKQVVAITAQIRSNNKSITVAEARAAAERQVAQNWGGLVQKVKQGQRVQQQVNQSGQKLVQAQNQNVQAQQQGAAGGRTGRFGSLSNMGTTAAFAIPLLANQLGDSIGGTTGAGVASAATAFSSSFGVGAQFGPIGAFVGALTGAVAAVEAFSSGVAAKEAEIAQTKIDQAIEGAERSFEAFNKNVGDAGAFRDIANSLATIRAQEQKLSESRQEAEAPGIFTSLGRSIGLLSAPTAQELGGAEAARQRGGAELAQRTIQAGLAGGLDYYQLNAKLAESGQSMDILINDILAADTAYQEQIAEIKSRNLTASQEERAIQSATASKRDQIEQDIKLQSAQAAQERASAKLTKSIQVASASITRTFNNLDQSITVASNGFKQASSEINKIITGATGFSRSLAALETIQNPRAFGRAEQNQAIRQGSQFAGADRAFMQQMSRFSLDVNDIIGGIAATGQRTGEDPNITAQKTIDAVTDALEAQFGQTQLTEQIRNDLSEAVKKAAASGGDVDIQKLLEDKIPEFNIGQRAVESTTKALQLLSESFNFVSNAVNEYAKINQTLRDNEASYQGTLLRADLALKEALGQRVDVRERVRARQSEAATRAGVAPQQLTGAALGARRDDLQARVDRLGDQLEQARNSFDSTVPGATQQLLQLEKQFASAENELKSTEDAIGNLPKVIEGNINDIIGEIGRVQQELAAQQQAGANFAERLVGSTPQELAELSGSFNLLNNTLNGQITTINQSQAAQQAYFQSLRNGSSQQEAYAAAQQAFAGQTRSALGLFNELTQLSGLEGPEINSIRADLLENFARAQGMGVQNNPMFQQILEALRRPPEEDPQIRALRGLLTEQQTALTSAMNEVNEGILQKQADILQSANQTFVSQLEQVRLKFDEAQLNQMSLGISRPGATTGARPLQDGGVVYASKGQYVNYQPKGTDTVPAMLTPGEFVVNAKSTKNNLGLLRAINSSAGSGKTFSKGGVVYAAGGFDDWDDILERRALTTDPYTGEQLSDMPASSAPDTTTGTRSKPTKYEPKYRPGRAAKLGVRRVQRRVAQGRRTLNQFGQQVGAQAQDFAIDTGRAAGRQVARGARGVGNYVRGNARSLGTQFGVQTALNYAGVDPNVSQAVGMGADVAGGLRAGQSLRGATGGALAANTAFDFVQTAGEIIYDRRAYDEKKRRESETNIGVVEGGLSGLSRPVDTIIRGGYTIASTAEAFSEANRSADRTRRMSGQGADTINNREYWMNGLSGPARTYVSETIRINLERERLEADKSIDPAKKQELLAILDRQQAGLPQYTADNVPSSMGSQNQADQAVQRAIDRGTPEVQRRNVVQAQRVAENTAFMREYNAARAESLGLDTSSGQIYTEQQLRQKEVENAVVASTRQAEQEEQKREKLASLGLNPNVPHSDDKIEAAKRRATDRRLAEAYEEEKIENYEARKESHNQAERYIDKPFLPPNNEIYNEEYQQAIAQRESITNEIARLQSQQFAVSQSSPFDDSPLSAPEETTDARRLKFAENKNRKLRELYSRLAQQNITINRTNDTGKEYLRDNNLTRDEAWAQYESGQKREEAQARREEIAESRKLDRQKADQMRAVAQFVGIQPPDKFANPSAFFKWRETVGARLQKQFPFASRTPEALKALGIGPDVVNALYQPFSPDQAAAIYGAMLSSTGLSSSQQTVVAALRQSKTNLANKVDSDPRLQKIIASASPEDQQAIYKQFKQTFGKQVRAIGSLSRVAANFGYLNPVQQRLASANLYQRAAKSGLVDSRLSDEENINRLNAMGGGELAGLLYPGQQTQNRAIRFNRPRTVSKGGVIYASTGMMVPYEPRGTDTVPAMLTPGEFVINRAATQKHRPLLEAINRSKGGAVKYLADGGISTDKDITKFVGGQPIERENETARNVKTNLAITQTNNRDISENKRNTTQSFGESKSFALETAQVLRDEHQQILNRIDERHSDTRASIEELQSRETRKVIDLLLQLELTPGFAEKVAAFAGPAFDNIMGAGDFAGLFSRGGMVYASKGQYVNYQPKGTDTIPAMLTPGEFVVNAKATKENLGMLQAINSGAMSRGGVVYAQEGGQTRRQRREAAGHSVPEDFWGDKVDVTDRFALKNQAAIMIRNVGKYTDDKGKQKLQQEFDRGLGISSVTVNPLLDDIGTYTSAPNAGPRTSAPGGMVQFRARRIKSPTVRHEFAHAIGNKNNAALLRPLITPALIEELRSSEYKTLGNTNYELFEFQKWPGELFATLASIDSANHGPHAKKFLKDSMYALGYGEKAKTPRQRGFAKGGVVYANSGMLVPYEPRGTDTVPAMLTPGEFVVNRDATQRNLGALQAMNRGGRVSYLQEGGMAGGDASILGFSRSLQSATQMLTQFGQVLQQLQNNLPSGPNAEAASGNGVNTSGIEQFTQQFGQFVEQLAAINLPPVIRVEGQVTANVNFAGAEALKSLSDTTIRQVVEDTVNAEFNKRSRDNEGQF